MTQFGINYENKQTMPVNFLLIMIVDGCGWDYNEQYLLG